jgi:hypothetical protein
MRKLLTSTFVAAVLLLGVPAGSAWADPSFGPGAGQGQGNNEPHENDGTRCHPPGQTSDSPECR